jgi:hypothetical protein
MSALVASHYIAARYQAIAPPSQWPRIMNYGKVKPKCGELL